MATLAPSAAKARAMPWPMPDAPPVMRTDFPESFILIVSLEPRVSARLGARLYTRPPAAVDGPRCVVTHTWLGALGIGEVDLFFPEASTRGAEMRRDREEVRP